MVRLSTLEAHDGPAVLAARAHGAIGRMAAAGARERTAAARLDARARIQALNELCPERAWTEPVALSRQQTDSVSALAWARSGKKSHPPAGASLTLLEEAGKIAEQLRNSRRMRYQLRETLSTKSLQARLQKCGSVMLAQADGVSIARGEHGAHFAGVMACGLVWTCPVCSAKIARERQGMVDQLLRRHLPTGGGALFLTLTISHRWGDDLKALRTMVATLYRKLWAGRKGKALRAHWGIAGHVRTLESTHGLNGWHPHLHCILLTEGELIEGERDQDGKALQESIAERWCDLAEKAGLTRPLEAQQHCEQIHSPEDAARYLAKYGAAAELAGWNNKQAREGGRTPFQILADYQREGKRHDLQLWHRWEKDIKGARFLTWSKGLRARYAITEKTDEEIAQREESPSQGVALLNRAMWRTITHHHTKHCEPGAGCGRIPRGLRAQLLEVAELEGGAAVAQLLEGLPWHFEGARVYVLELAAENGGADPNDRSAPENGGGGYVECARGAAVASGAIPCSGAG